MDWTEPGAFPVSPGVFRIPLPLPGDGLRAVNVYAIADSSGLVMVDAGWALESSRRSLEAALKEIGGSVSDITRFLITHVHADHYSQAVAVRREFGTRVALGAGERANVVAVTGRPRRFGPDASHLRACGAQPVLDLLAASGRRPRALTWEPPDEWLAGGTSVPLAGRSLVAVETPGHTSGHLVFADASQGLLFAGDHVLPHITPSIGFQPVSSPGALGDYLSSLALVRRMPDMRLLPAHGPVTDSVHARIDELVAHHDKRLAQTLAAVRSGSGTAYETARALPWTRRDRRLTDLDPFNQLLAVNETEAHLELLVAQARLRRSVSDDIICYTVN